MLDLTTHWTGFLSLFIFVIAYVLVVFEEAIDLRKSKPVLVAAGVIWALIGISYTQAGMSDKAHEHAVEIIAEYGELFLFLLVAITYVNTLEERRVFDSLRAKLVKMGLELSSTLLAHRLTHLFTLSVIGQLDDCFGYGGSCHCSWVPVIAFRSYRMHQHRGSRERRWRVFSIWRHHYLNGLAKRQTRIL